MAVDVLDLLDIALPQSLDAGDPVATALRPRLERADAFVIVTPEYNRSIPGPLKTLIDSFNAEWTAKPVGFVGYGLSVSGGVRAIEHLRLIFAEFHAVGMKTSVIFPALLDHLDPTGGFAPSNQSADSAAKAMLDQLEWWARALRDAKAVRAYSG